MLIGVPKEIKNHEYRVGLTPASVRELVHHGHAVLVQAGAGAGIGAGRRRLPGGRREHRRRGGRGLCAGRDDRQGQGAASRPSAPCCVPGQVLFTYLHLAPDPEQCRDLVASGAVCIAYETVTDRSGGLPLLAPMSEVAGRMAVQAGAYCLERAHGGMGVLLGGVPGVPPARVLILGGGVVGSNAAQIAVGTGAQVMVMDRSVDALRRIDRLLGARVMTVFSNRDNVERERAGRRPGDRRGADPRRRGAEAGDARDAADA